MHGCALCAMNNFCLFYLNYLKAILKNQALEVVVKSENLKHILMALSILFSLAVGIC